MRIARFVSILFLLALCSGFIVGCGGGGGGDTETVNVAGTWVYLWEEGSGYDTVIYDASGNFSIVNAEGETQSGTYSLVGSTIEYSVMWDDGSMTWYEGIVSGDQIRLDYRNSDDTRGTLIGHRIG